jgi:hypothetical protein
MKSRGLRLLALSFLPLPLLVLSAFANSVNLGTAGSYAVLAGSAVTNTGPSVLSGNLGVWPGTAVSGFPPGLVTGGTIHAGDAAAQMAQADLTTAYNAAMGLSPTATLTGTDLGGLVLTPGVYFFASAAQLTGASGDRNQAKTAYQDFLTLWKDADPDPVSDHSELAAVRLTA